MRGWIVALVSGAVGAAVGALAGRGAVGESAMPLWAFNGGAWGAILGAILGSTAEIVDAIRHSGRG
jgi:hypothetical protein